MKQKIFTVALLAVLLSSCNEKETPGGVKYNLVKKGNGAVPVYGNFLVLNMILRDSKDSLWFDSKNQPVPVVIPVQDASMDSDPGEYGVIKQLTVGDSVTFKLDALTVFGKTRRQRVPAGTDPKSLFTFNIGLKNVWTEAQMRDEQQKFEMAAQKNQIKSDSITIATYLTEKGIEAKSTPTGLRYVVNKEGKGDLIKPGQTAYVHYAGFLLNGKIFDTSLSKVAKENNLDNGAKDQPYPVVVNTGSVIKGWDQMLLLMNKGMRVRVYIPSALAYGPQPYGPNIPANSILLFDMEVVDVK